MPAVFAYITAPLDERAAISPHIPKKMWTTDHLRRMPPLQSPNVLLNQWTDEEREAFRANYVRGGPAGRPAPAEA